MRFVGACGVIYGDKLDELRSGHWCDMLFACSVKPEEKKEFLILFRRVELLFVGSFCVLLSSWVAGVLLGLFEAGWDCVYFCVFVKFFLLGRSGKERRE